VIGGGIIGCSTAYHLARDHKLKVVLLEQNRLTSGSTWHAAGLVGQLRSSASITQVLKYSVDLYKKLEAETGLQTGWKMTGCLGLPPTPTAGPSSSASPPRPRASAWRCTCSPPPK
jgi:sarcosine dehydrogenase